MKINLHLALLANVVIIHHIPMLVNVHKSKLYMCST